jgi:uncharacterized Ntn-hydrolase superfamily protein
MTYSVVARDPQTGRFAIAVQSHYLGVGPVVPWLEAGVGAVATQAQVNVSLGPLGLDLLRNGRSAEEVVATLVASDPGAAARQIGVVDREGRAAAFTGSETIPAAGHEIGEGFSIQGNLLHSPDCWPAMAAAYRAAVDEPFTERLLRTLEAAEATGGDVRGKQSAALIVFAADLQPAAWQGRLLDLRIEDHPDPIPELRRLVNMAEAYALLDDAGDAARAGLSEAERYAESRRRAPEAYELAFWMAVEFAKRGEIEAARRELAVAVTADPRWRTTLEHLAAGSREGMTSELVARLLA